jgi:hypothetical protein
MKYSIATCTTGTGFADFMPDLKPPHIRIEKERDHSSRVRIGIDAF